MRKVNKLVKKETIGFSYTTSDLVEFESNTKSGLVHISNFGDKSAIALDINEENMTMLMEFFKHVLADLKVIPTKDEDLVQGSN